MLWLDLIDILFFIAGGLIGAIVMSALAVSTCDECRNSNVDECKDCLYREYVMEVIENERNE